jgi:hypothetical protein
VQIRVAEETDSKKIQSTRVLCPQICAVVPDVRPSFSPTGDSDEDDRGPQGAVRHDANPPLSPILPKLLSLKLLRGISSVKSDAKRPFLASPHPPPCGVGRCRSAGNGAPCGGLIRRRRCQTTSTGIIKGESCQNPRTYASTKVLSAHTNDHRMPWRGVVEEHDRG